MAKKQAELSPELKELVDTKIAVLSTEDVEKVEKYIAQQRKQRQKNEKQLEQMAKHLKTLGYMIVKKEDLSEQEGTPATQAPEKEVAATEESEEPPPEPGIIYRDPDTGETWEGRGKSPKWVKNRLAEGYKLEDLKGEPETKPESAIRF